MFQLVKPQLLSVLPELVRHLSSDNYVTYTYAAISIERILFIRQGTQLMYVIEMWYNGSRLTRLCRFTEADVREVAPGLLNALLSKVEKAPSPEKMAENDYLMKCPYLLQLSYVHSVDQCWFRCHACHCYCAVNACWRVRADSPATGCYTRCYLQEPE